MLLLARYARCAATNRFHVAVRLFSNRLVYLKDSNAAAHSVDSDIFQSSDSSICALQDLTLTFIFLTHCQIVGNLSLYASTSCAMTHRWRVVTRDRDKKSHYNLNYDSHQPLFYLIAKIERCVE